MIAHVAAVGEDRGRVVLRLGPSARLSPVAIEAAVRVAQAFQSEIESLFIEDRQILDLASFTFARETSLSGTRTRALSVADVERELRITASDLQRRVADVVRRAEIPLRVRSVRDEPVRALAAVCAENGPWNVVAIGEPFEGNAARLLGELFQNVWGTTGVLVAGPKARRTGGPVVALIEDLERVPPMLRTVERLAAVTGGQATLLVVDQDEPRLQWIEGQVRLAMGAGPSARLLTAHLALTDVAAIAETLRRLGAGFVIAQYGGLFVHGDSADVSRFAALLEGPLFLVR